MVIKLKELLTKTNSESGMADIFVILVVGCLLTISSWFLSNLAMHSQVVNAHTQKFKEEYQIEGLLVEAIQLIKDKGHAFQEKAITSSYNPIYIFSVEDGVLTISKLEGRGKNVSPLAEVAFSWQEDGLKIDRVETRYNLSYSK